VNENLRQALLRARLREEDVAARLGVDPKTVRRWLEGRVPYPSNRAALADLVGADESDLWPESGGPLAPHTRPEELATIYPHRWAIPRETWARFFASAEHEIGILAYSALFLAEDAGLLRILTDKARHGVKIRIMLGDPDSHGVGERGAEEGIDDAMSAKVRNALALYRPLCAVPDIDIRLHCTRSCTTRFTELTVSSWLTSTRTA
jgi:transcriptional regulator with XRE-family HTH domain